MNVRIKRLSRSAIIPQYQTPGAAGFDFHCTEDFLLAPGETMLISTGLAFGVPVGFELQVRPRSGLSAKTGVRVCNSPGTVDSDYVGEVKIILQNTGTEYFTARSGDRIAQGVVCPVVQATFEVVEALEQTERGDKGFGSSGV